jgi:amino acid adenylation domain-containing protein
MAYLLHQLLDRSAACEPDREALRFEGESLHYAEYATRSDRCAAALHELGIRRGDRVGIFSSKGIDAAVAQYGIWKAGAASVPFDPWLPPERLAAMLRDCGIRVLFSDRSRLHRLQAAPLRASGLEHLVGIEPDETLPAPALAWREIELLPTRPPEPQLTEQDLAYIFYTSGSTGEPKGMMHTHRSGLSFVDFSLELSDLSSEDRIGNHAPLHFDLSLFDYVSAASVAATTVIVSEERQKLPASVSQLIEDERLTVWYSVPAAWTQMLMRGALEKRSLASLRLVLFGGEPFPTHLLRQAMEQAPQARFCHVYGVTETNVCTYFFVPRPPPEGDAAIPIGRICPNMEGVVLDDGDVPVEAGEGGELVIRGPGVMRGYWNRPELDREVFWRRSDREDPFYRTGDLVRCDSKGDFAFLGRKDRQIKSRGHRIELDEVQAALCADPSIAEAAVYAVPDGEGSLQLEAALALREGASWDRADVVRRLKAHTAAYAVPAEMRIVARLPRTSAGKIDFQALKRSLAGGPEGPRATGHGLGVRRGAT